MSCKDLVITVRKNKFINGIVDYCKSADKILWLLTIFISVFSLVILKSVSRATNGDYFKSQLFAVIVGIVGAYIITLIDYTTLSNFWYLIAGASVFLMLYTIFFGINISSSGGVNATAWINLGGRTFQPSELVKIGFIVTYAKHLDVLSKKGVINHPLHIILLGVHAAVPVLLCHQQGDDGAGVVFFAIFFFMSLSAGIKLKYFIILGVLILVAIPILWKFVLNDYQILRFTAVYNLDDPTVALNEGYQQYQGRISIGSGGFFGQGLFHGQRVETNAVTFQHSDFIFSVVGEELGFIGCTAVILSLLLLMVRALYIATKSRDDMGRYICFGYFGLIALQTISNIGMCLALMPVMGVTLPFYSAGGSSAACLYFGLGLLQSVYMRRYDRGGIKLSQNRPVKIDYRKLAESDL